MPQTNSSPLNNFQIISKLGEGSYAQVYKVLRLSDNQFYAMKRVKMNSLKEKDRENALNEVRILASYDDPHIIGYKETFLDEDSQVLYIIMEFATDGDLQQMIKTSIQKDVHISENIIWKALYQMTGGLKRLHDMKIVHRDLKCANIFISEGVFKLGDLNVSKVAKKGFVYTQTGTPFYASPEVWRDEPYDMRSDIWSLGCVVYEMATHSPPFKANDMQSLFKKIQKGVFEDIPRTYSRDLQTILKSMIQVQPFKRPTCQQLLNNTILIRNVSDQISMEQFNLENNDELLKTIQLPKNLKSLKEVLPLSKYENVEPGLTFQTSKKPTSKAKHYTQRYHSAASISKPQFKADINQDQRQSVDNKQYPSAPKQSLHSLDRSSVKQKDLIISQMVLPNQVQSVRLKDSLQRPMVHHSQLQSSKLRDSIQIPTISRSQMSNSKQLEPILNRQIQSAKLRDPIYTSMVRHSQVPIVDQGDSFSIPVIQNQIQSSRQREFLQTPIGLHNQIQSAKQRELQLLPILKSNSPNHKIGVINSIKYNTDRAQINKQQELVIVKSNAIGDILPLKQYNVESPNKRIITNQDSIPDLVQLLKSNDKRHLSNSPPLMNPPSRQISRTNNLKIIHSQIMLDGLIKPNPNSIQQILRQPVLNILEHPFPTRAKVIKKKQILKTQSFVQQVNVIQNQSKIPVKENIIQQTSGRKVIQFKSQQSLAFKKVFSETKERPESAYIGSEAYQVGQAKILQDTKERPESAQTCFDQNMARYKKLLQDTKDRPDTNYYGLEPAKLKEKYQHYYPISQSQELYLEKMKNNSSSKYLYQ